MRYIFAHDPIGSWSVSKADQMGGASGKAIIQFALTEHPICIWNTTLDNHHEGQLGGDRSFAGHRNESLEDAVEVRGLELTTGFPENVGWRIRKVLGAGSCLADILSAFSTKNLGFRLRMSLISRASVPHFL